MRTLWVSFIKGCGFWLCSCPFAPHFSSATPAFSAAARKPFSSAASGNSILAGGKALGVADDRHAPADHVRHAQGVQPLREH